MQLWLTLVAHGVGRGKWLQHESSRRKKAGKSRLTELVSLCQVPFILTPQAKCAILQAEATMHKQNEIQNSGLQVCRRACEGVCRKLTAR